MRKLAICIFLSVLALVCKGQTEYRFRHLANEQELPHQQVEASLTNISRPYQNLFSEFLSGADGIVQLYYDYKNSLWVGRISET